MNTPRLFAAVVLLSTPVLGQETDVPAPEATTDEGLLPVPDYSGDWRTNPKLTGDWGGLRQDWANRGIFVDLDWYQAMQDIVDGGIREGNESSTNLDYRLTLDLMRMQLLPGALVTVRHTVKGRV